MLGSEAKVTELSTAVAAEISWAWPTAKLFLILGGIAGIVTTWNGFLLGASRLMNAMALDHQLPSWLVDSKSGSSNQKSKRALWFIFFVTCLAPLLGQATLIWFINAGGLGVVIAYILVTISFIKYRFTHPNVKRPFKIRFWKLWSCCSLVLSSALLVLYLPMSPSGLKWPHEWGIVIIWCGVGLFLFLNKGKEWKPKLN